MLSPLADAGADEFYMGFFDPGWKEKFGAYSDLNRLTLFKETANRYELKDIGPIVKEVHARKAVLYITLNAPGYSKSQLDVIDGYLKQLSEYGADGIITSVPELIPMIEAHAMKPIASTMCCIQNSDMAAWYKSLGMKRMILPRELTTDEIFSIMKNVPDVEYEVFFMRNGCRYSDGNCLGLHGGEHGALCYSLRTAPAEYFTAPGEEDLWWQIKDTHEKFSTVFREYACGQCALYRFLKAGVSALKIVGRLDDSEEILQDVRLTSENIAVAENCGSEEEYLANMRLPGNLHDYCRGGMSCYYPEVRWKNHNM